MKRDQKIWLLVCIISYVIFIGLLSMKVFYDISFNHSNYIVIISLIIAILTFIMYGLTEFMSTKEMLSILTENLKNSKMKIDQKIWLLISGIALVIFIVTFIGTDDGIRYKYDIYVSIFSAVISFWSFIMYCVTKYMSTREIVSTLVEKALDW